MINEKLRLPTTANSRHNATGLALTAMTGRDEITPFHLDIPSATLDEYLHLIGPLTDPAAHGADPADTFHVVVPSIPGWFRAVRSDHRYWRCACCKIFSAGVTRADHANLDGPRRKGAASRPVSATGTS